MDRRTAAVAADGALQPSPFRQPRPGVWSEVGTLRSVLVHRPGRELRAAVADPERALFSDRVREREATAEHDAFTATLRSQGVETLYLEDLLLDVNRNARRVGQWLPNLMFTRDPSVWIGDGVACAAMATPVRRREADLFARVYRDHPRFRSASRWTGAGKRLPVFEGGDLLYAGAGRVIVGTGTRTTLRGATRLARALIEAKAAAEVVTLGVPRGAGFHLDLVMTMVDRDKLAIRRGVRPHLRALLWRAHRFGIRSRLLADPMTAFPDPVETIELEEDRVAGHPLSWDHGINVLTLAPGRVISYAHNRRSNERLSAAGIEVLPVRGSMLARGRGGPRCLTCPVARDP